MLLLSRSAALSRSLRPRSALLQSHRPPLRVASRAMSSDAAPTHTDPVTGELVSKRCARAPLVCVCGG
jgi:hypothetical protein